MNWENPEITELRRRVAQLEESVAVLGKIVKDLRR